MRIRFSSKFERSYRKFSVEVRARAKIHEVVFRGNPFNSRLKTHKLHGKLSGLWSFSVDRRCHILFEFDGDDVIFLDIGTHDLYR